MIKNLPGILTVCLVLAMVLPVGAQNVQLLPNNGFETWTNGPSSPPDQWININADSIYVSRDASNFYEGLYSANLTWITPTQAQCDFLSDPIAVTAGESYACSTWALDNDSGGRITISFRWNVSNYYPSGLYTVDSPSWQQIGFTQVAPAGATSLRVGIRCYDYGSWDGSSTVYVDNVTLWGPPVTGNVPPSITGVLRYPYPIVNPEDNLIVEATIIDTDGSLVSDSLYARVLPGTFAPVSHDSITTGSRFWFTVGNHNAGDSVEYYVAATDNEGARTASPTRGYTVSGGTPPSNVPIYALQHTTNSGAPPDDCYPSDSIGTAQTVTGIVVGRYERSETYNMRFFVQDATSPWSGLYVYQTLQPVQIGDSVTVSGILAEYYLETELGNVSDLTIHSSGHTLPAHNVVTCATLGSDSCSATAEPYEGMIIQINNVTLIDFLPSPDVGEFLAIDESGDTCIVSNDLSLGGADSCVFELNHNYSYIRGIGRYTYGEYRIMPRTSADLYSAPTECTGGNIFNVENSFDPGGDSTQCWPSPRANDTVTVCGIVTAVMQGTSPRFYLQDQANTAWGGMYCYDYRLDSGDNIVTEVGDYVQVTARVKEYYGWTEFDSVISFTQLGSNQPLPDTTVITVANLSALCEYTTEPYENILVRVNNVTIVSDNGFGEFWIRDNLGTDSIRIDSDLWNYGTDQPNPVPSVGALYDYIIGVVKWEGRQGLGYDRGWVIFPRFALDYDQAIIPEPNIADVWSTNSTTLNVTFDRVMDPTSVANPSHYTTFGGLGITSAVLDPINHRKVILTTAAQPNNVVDTLIVTGVCDSLGYCMTTPHSELYHSGLTTIATVNTPDAGGDSSAIVGHIVTVRGVIVSDSTMSYPTNPFINDGSGPPYNGVMAYTGGLGMTQPIKGDTVMFTARVDEYFRATELADLGVFANFSIVGSGADPVPYEATAAELNAAKEGFEGVLVTLCDSFVVTGTQVDTFGFFIRSLSSPNDSVNIHRQPYLGHTRYSYIPVTGDRIIGVTGVFRYQRDQYRLMPRYDADFNSSATWCGGGPDLCVYRPGDINGNGTTNGIDVGYGVNYFKGAAAPPITCPMCPQPAPFYAAGDVNGSCVFNGIDVTFFVNYLKGIVPNLLNCPTCPPAPTAGPAQASPTLVPTLKPRVLTSQAE